MTQLIESGLRFVAIDQRAHDNLAEAAVAGTVTIEVLPQQVAKLAQATGSLLLSLADQGDATVADAIEVDQCSFLDLDDAPVEVAEEDPPILPAICTVRTPRGAEVVEMPVVCPTNYARRVKSNGRTGRRGGPCGPPPTGTAPGQPPLDLTSHPPHPAAEGDGPRDQGAYAQ